MQYSQNQAVMDIIEKNRDKMFYTIFI